MGINHQMNMPDNPDKWAWLATFVHDNWPSLYAGGLAFLIAFMRIGYNGGKLRQYAFEAPLCGLLGIASSYGLTSVGLSAAAAGGVASLVGLFGIETCRTLALSFIKNKLGSD
ncbi:phage holin, lambda family [Celerinatantimonas sp. MCCC 1A17872]|uniref:phage holin, lambda family n=1 Tax=Celerinatantimonas sp. MCCC 1A17872 TaxID=3177514 RepID=UPI0038C11A7A